MSDAVRGCAIFGLAPDGTIERANAATAQVAGWSPTAVVGRHYADLYAAEDAAAGRAHADLLAAATRGHASDEGWRVRSDGTPFRANVVLVPLRSGQGDVEGFVSYLRDSGTGCLAERVLREKMDELETANRRLAELTREQEHFIHAVSHDLRSPLLAVGGMIEVLAESLGRGDTGGAALALDRVRRNVARTEDLLQALLEYVRAGRSLGHDEVLDLGREVDTVLADLAPRLEARRVRVTSPGAWPLVRFSRTETYEVLSNLVSNAAKFGGRAGEDPQVELSWEHDSGWVRLRVSDNGLGIPEDKREDVFALFSRLDSSSAEGTGLGLAIVKRLVERRGGQAWVEESSLGGASFVVTLPAA
ncbi:MAG TPA: PAS domain-containing sensor histidine kinase [Deinococcales bacterium]|nr:PAS domain-containing sensor histidine kinase [Deinococcales bacterium]